MTEKNTIRIIPPAFHEKLSGHTFTDIRNELRTENAAFSSAECTADLEDHSFFSCTFDNVTWAAEQRGLLFTDVTFTHCDFSNTSLKECVFRRCSFRSCRLTGCDLSSSTFENVTITDSVLDYANYSGSKMKRFLIRDCRADSSSFVLCSFHHVYFRDVSLVNAEFLDTSLKDVDLSTCDIAGFSVNVENLKGVYLNEEQAAACARLIGIRIVHPSE